MDKGRLGAIAISGWMCLLGAISIVIGFLMIGKSEALGELWVYAYIFGIPVIMMGILIEVFWFSAFYSNIKK